MLPRSGSSGQSPPSPTPSWEPWEGSHPLPRSGSSGQSPPSPTPSWEPWEGSLRPSAPHLPPPRRSRCSASPTPPALWLQAARPRAKAAFAHAIYGSMLSGGPEGRGDSPDGDAACARPTWWNVRGKSTCTPFPSNRGNLMPWTTFRTQRSASGGAPLTRTRLARPAGSASNDTDTMGF